MNSDTLSRKTAVWPAYSLVQIEPATNGAIRSFCGKRHLGEMIVQRIKYWRRVAIRYEKHSSTFLAFSTLASSIDYIRFQ
jgi:hypothetical protein